MFGLPAFTQLLWAASLAVKLVLCALVFVRRHFQKLPAFSAYLVLNLCHGLLLVLLYSASGFDTPGTTAVAWFSRAIVFVAKALAVAELCRQILQSYRGIWALGWRLMLAAAGAVVLYATVAASGNLQLAVLQAHRGLELAIAVALVCLLVLVRYYSITVHPAFKAIAVGFCIYSCFVVLNYSILEQWLRRYAVLWNAFDVLAFLAVGLIWARALWQPLPARAEAPPFLSPYLYAELSSRIHARLRLLNDRLAAMFRI